MAEPVQRGRFTEAVARFFGLKGRVVPSLEPYLLNTVPVSLIEDRHPPHRKTFQWSAFLNAAAGTKATAKFAAVPNKVFHLERVSVMPASTTKVRWGTKFNVQGNIDDDMTEDHTQVMGLGQRVGRATAVTDVPLHSGRPFFGASSSTVDSPTGGWAHPVEGVTPFFIPLDIWLIGRQAPVPILSDQTPMFLYIQADTENVDLSISLVWSEWDLWDE